MPIVFAVLNDFHSYSNRHNVCPVIITRNERLFWNDQLSRELSRVNFHFRFIKFRLQCWEIAKCGQMM